MNKVACNIAGILIFVVLLSMTGCVVYPEHQNDYGYGPPPHAPAHGYRTKYHNHDLIYDAPLGVYVVVDLPDIYFSNNYYYRHSHEGWFYSHYVDRDWDRYDESKLPPGLAKKYGGNGKGKGKGKWD